MKLELKNISKNFHGVKALQNVDFQLKDNSIHALLGENGAGKSTLVKILCGVYQPDSGTINLNNQQQTISNPAISLSLGISAIHQESVMFDELTVTENIFIGNHLTKSNGLIDWGLMENKTKKLLQDLEANIEPNEKIKDLSIAQRHIVQISRSLIHDAEIVIMDEPTASLSQKEINELYTIIRNLKKQNKSIIFISHKLDEVMEVCDDFTVLRDGELIKFDKISNTNKDQLITYMAGREVNQIFPKNNVTIENEIFQVKDLYKKTQFKNISFNLRKKEILGFYGLVGSGRTEIMKSIFGITKLDEGEIIFKDQKISIAKPSDAIDQGIVYLSEERQQLGMTGLMSVKDNINMAILDRNSQFYILDNLKEIKNATAMQEKLNIKVSYWSQLTQSLSGGNQQKTVIAKWLSTKPEVLILDEPTKGIDVRSKSAVHEFMGELVEEGMSIIMISSELPEILGMCDRVVVMYKGLIKDILDVKNASSEQIVKLASGES
ncbi:sugar ABC transporter ATP-binding protein [Alphaproteobacteria bacterium]|jgi:rhamnose transport system ATP-binding protein|nr:sugar ABC transporter ATP-binding protein [Alphaproteobacteria bacterium]MDB2635637.1 sugar ABC transporter ATP-binding protein [Alphaproteobacteria bacterium]MDB3863243.1 sugar ABC transporter ATP-binding protein [Alphaproteobacteria bacterium]MDB3973634.1 sugar ABC transporter ATP-binding protein [Alphaproteobacteria bacterium]MDC0594321.1 sugar ABC transporter ATP-binding protein [Alphaproteobacteria bacterium]